VKKKIFSIGRRSSISEEADLLPMMSLMLILIPFLVGNVAFYQLKAVSVTTPGLAQNDSPPPPATRNVIVQIHISNSATKLSLIDEDSADTIKSWKFGRNSSSFTDMVPKRLTLLKRRYLKLSTILVSVDQKVDYKHLVSVLEKCKVSVDEKKLATGAKSNKFNIVILPKGSV